MGAEEVDCIRRDLGLGRLGYMIVLDWLLLMKQRSTKFVNRLVLLQRPWLQEQHHMLKQCV